MCGIAGRVNGSGAPVAPELLNAMIAVLAHRGPDDAEIYVNGPVGLAHRRLAILDLSPSGRQPMANEDGTVHITLNGEIYNFAELRRGLEGRGHVFRSRSDTEVVLHLYEEMGPDVVHQLRGMFAFAIWDARQRRLVLARDRVGKKPLYYAQLGQDLVFGSEIKALLQVPELEVRPDHQALHEYLTYQYVPAPRTAFAGIRKLPPAHVLVWQDGDVRIHRYWSLSYANKLSISEDEAVERFLQLLEESVRLRLASDVAIGAFLSGGLDSSAVVAVMARLVGRPIKTFSIGFKEQEYNELPYARRVAQHLGTEHHEFIVEPDAVGVLPKLVWYYGEPFADSSAIPSYYVAQMTRQHVTVALNGDGGDESFAGYERYKANVLAQRLQVIPAFLRRWIPRFTRRIPVSQARGALGRLRRFGEYLAVSPEYRYGQWMSHFTHEAKLKLYTPDFWETVGGTGNDALEHLLKVFATSDGPDLVDRTLDVDVQTYLPDDLLVKVDVACMANSLEGRSPLLDHRLMEFAAALPSSYKLKGMETKYLFKKAMRRLLPEDIIDRPKMGFGVPIDHWFRGQLKDMAYEVLLSKTAQERGYFHQGYVKQLLDDHVAGRAANQYQIWSLLFLELWHQMFIDRTLSPGQSLTGVGAVASA